MTWSVITWWAASHLLKKQLVICVSLRPAGRPQSYAGVVTLRSDKKKLRADLCVTMVIGSGEKLELAALGKHFYSRSMPMLAALYELTPLVVVEVTDAVRPSEQFEAKSLTDDELFNSKGGSLFDGFERLVIVAAPDPPPKLPNLKAANKVKLRQQLEAFVNTLRDSYPWPDRDVRDGFVSNVALRLKNDDRIKIKLRVLDCAGTKKLLAC